MGTGGAGRDMRRRTIAATTSSAAPAATTRAGKRRRRPGGAVVAIDECPSPGRSASENWATGLNRSAGDLASARASAEATDAGTARSEEHTSELQSRFG